MWHLNAVETREFIRVTAENKLTVDHARVESASATIDVQCCEEFLRVGTHGLSIQYLSAPYMTKGFGLTHCSFVWD
jgi:hypothetical protein